jgi:hypothetical protein
MGDGTSQEHATTFDDEYEDELKEPPSFSNNQPEEALEEDGVAESLSNI